VTLPAPLDRVEAALRRNYRTVPRRASVSFVGVEPIEVLCFEPAPDERVYVSLGMSRRVMTPPDVVAPSGLGPRAELLLHIRDAADVYVPVWRQLAVLAAAPAVEGVVYAAGMTVDLGAPLAGGSRCTGAVVADSTIAPIESPAGAVTVLRIVPATASELAWCRVHGSAALRERWADQEIDLLDLARASAQLG
jgi:hypothetical protein